MNLLLTLPGEIDVFLKTPAPEDAPEIMKFDLAVKNEEHLQGNDPDEAPLTIEERAQWIRSCQSPDCFSLIGIYRGEVIAFLESRVRARPRMNSHVLRFFISIRRDFWGKGLGTGILTAMLEWAQNQARIEKVSLGVLSSNKRAIHLYRKLGFVEEGRKKREFQFSDGTYADDISMALFLKRSD